MNDLNDIKYKNEISNHSNQFTHNFDDKEMGSVAKLEI